MTIAGSREKDSITIPLAGKLNTNDTVYKRPFKFGVFRVYKLIKLLTGWHAPFIAPVGSSGIILWIKFHLVINRTITASIAVLGQGFF